MSRTPLMVSVLSLCLALAPPAHARECADVRMPDSVTVDGTPLVLNGMGIREATVFNVNVYVAGLYVEQRSGNGAAIAASNTRRRLVLHFVREVERADIATAFNEGFGHTAGGSLAALQPRIRRLIGWVPNVSEGSELSFTYVPGTGLQVQVGRATRGTIEGEDFAQAFFGIWLGAHPPNPGLRRGLLGGRCE